MRLPGLSDIVMVPPPVSVTVLLEMIRSVFWLPLCSAIVPEFTIDPSTASVPWFWMSKLPVLLTAFAVPSSVPVWPP